MIEGSTLMVSLREAVKKGDKFDNNSAAGKWVMDTVGHGSPFAGFLTRIASPTTAAGVTLTGDAEQGWNTFLTGLRSKSAAKVKSGAAKITGAVKPPKPKSVARPKSAARTKPPRPSPPRKKPPAGKAQYIKPRLPAGSSAGAKSAKKRWDDAIARGSDPIEATRRRIGATKDKDKLAGIVAMLNAITTKAGKKPTRAQIKSLAEAAAKKPKPKPRPKPAAKKPKSVARPKPKSAAKKPKSVARPKSAAKKPKSAAKKPRAPRRRAPSQPAMRAAAEAAVKQAVVEAAKMHATGTATSGKQRVRFDFTLTPKK